MTLKDKLKTATSLQQPLFMEVTADATHQGKTMWAARMRDHVEEHGLRTTLVRIESSRVQVAMREGDVFIPTELFAQAEQMPGGVAGVIAPLFERLETLQPGGAVILDWAGGLGEHRLKAWAATSIDGFLADNGVAGLSFFLTTSVPDRMREAAEALEFSARVAPDLPRVLVLNERLGPFAFSPKSPAAEKFAALKKAHGDAPVLRMPKVEGESWSHLQPLALDTRDLLTRNAGVLAKQLGSREFLVRACISQIGAWHQLTRAEIGRVLPFREAERQA